MLPIQIIPSECLWLLYLIKIQGSVACVNGALVNVREIKLHCYWVNLCLLFVIEGSVNDGIFTIFGS